MIVKMARFLLLEGKEENVWGPKIKDPPAFVGGHRLLDIDHHANSFLVRAKISIRLQTILASQTILYFYLVSSFRKQSLIKSRKKCIFTMKSGQSNSDISFSTLAS